MISWKYVKSNTVESDFWLNKQIPGAFESDLIDRNGRWKVDIKIFISRLTKQLFETVGIDIPVSNTRQMYQK